MVCNPKLLSVSVRAQSRYRKQWVISKRDFIKERLEEQKWGLGVWDNLEITNSGGKSCEETSGMNSG